MIKLEELRIKQVYYEGLRQEFAKNYKILEKKRKNFLQNFPKNKINELAINTYVLGTEKYKDSFCYWIENELKDLGNMHGSTALKFGIYYGKTKSDPIIKYRFVKRFGKNEKEAFENVKNEIIMLLESAEKDNNMGIKKNTVSPMFKGKILSTYYPNKYLNIFTKEHLEHFLNNLEIGYNESSDEIDKREVLIEFKNSDAVMKDWTIYEFTRFLYGSFGRPVKKQSVHRELKPFIENKNEYPDINKVEAKFVELKINPENIGDKENPTKACGKIIDIEKENKRYKLLGNRGEEIVLGLEKEYLKSIDKIRLAEKIERVSEKDDSLGYDILSYEENGNEKFIEVKSTKQSPGFNANFLISSNQYKKAKEINNYYIYIVFNADSKCPKVWKIKKPLEYENKGVTLTPVNYRVIINTSKG